MIRAMIGTVAVLAGFAVVECSTDAGSGLTGTGLAGARAHAEQGRRDEDPRAWPKNSVGFKRQETTPTGTRRAMPRTAAARCIFGDFQ